MLGYDFVHCSAFAVQEKASGNGLIVNFNQDLERQLRSRSRFELSEGPIDFKCFEEYFHLTMSAFKGTETLEGEDARIHAKMKRIIEHDLCNSNKLKSEGGRVERSLKRA